MKIALCSTYVPFVYGGARNIVEWLQAMLEQEGHQVERIYLPAVDAPELLFPQMAAMRWIDLSAADRVICLRPQAHLIRHPHKILWFIHHIRAFYDLWDSPYRGFPDDAGRRAVRAALHAADGAALQEARHVFTNSRVVSDRLRQFNGVDSEVLYPPVFQPERFHCRAYGDEIVYICRLEHHKRQHLLVEAMRHTRSAVRLRLCGTSAGDDYPCALQSQIAGLGLQHKVVLENRWITEEEKVELLADCLAAAYLPVDEDSYGYPSVEASHAAKAILTTTDSGGVLELVNDGLNGLVSAPEPVALAAAMDRLFFDRQLARGMGEQARVHLETLNISWPHVLKRLLA
jgi:glycosyltransferase involved in cell wall biosynthesis